LAFAYHQAIIALSSANSKILEKDKLLKSKLTPRLDKTKYYPQSKQTPITCADHSSGFGIQPQIVHSV
jgi:hypothetical protein